MTDKYHNTNRESGKTLGDSRKNVEKQEDVILAYFKNHPEHYMAPHEIQEMCLPNVPITSIRRALTNLTEAGHLLKTDLMVEGSYGKSVHTWTCNNQKGLVSGQMTLFA